MPGTADEATQIAPRLAALVKAKPQLWADKNALEGVFAGRKLDAAKEATSQLTALAELLGNHDQNEAAAKLLVQALAGIQQDHDLRRDLLRRRASLRTGLER